jgi:hypothetical protein
MSSSTLALGEMSISVCLANRAASRQTVQAHGLTEGASVLLIKRRLVPLIRLGETRRRHLAPDLRHHRVEAAMLADVADGVIHYREPVPTNVRCGSNSDLSSQGSKWRNVPDREVNAGTMSDRFSSAVRAFLI